jgi:two-component system OmpR family response regulator
MHTILIADDDPNITTALARRLEANHYGVLTAPDGFEALKLVLEEKPDLLLLDICMPIGIGFSVAERIRELKLGIPIIFLTASKTPGLREAAKDTGAAGYLEKPYEPEELLDLIKTTLQQHRTRAECLAQSHAT